MNMLLSLLSGVLIAVMVSINGNLTEVVGTYFAAVVIHIVGSLFAFILCMVKRQPVFKKQPVPWWAYLGGVIGVSTTLFNNYAFSRISMTSIIALSLLGQSMTSTVFDGFGLLGMKRHKIKASTWMGIAISLIGVFVMLDASIEEEVIAVLVSLAAGFSVVLSRTVNSRLSEKSGAIAGSFYNHLVGLPCCIVLWLIFSDMPDAAFLKPQPWMLTGGMLGVLVVVIFNIVVPKVSAFRLTLLSFIGQVFTGFALDLLSVRDISGGLFLGGVICAMGFLFSILIEFLINKRKLSSD